MPFAGRGCAIGRIENLLAWMKKRWTGATCRLRPALAVIGARITRLWQRLKPLRRFLAREKTRRNLRVAGLAALGAVVVLALAFFTFRNALLRAVLDSKLRSFARGGAGMVVEVREARFRGLAGVELAGVSLRSGDGAFAFSMGRAAIALDPARLLLGRPLPRRLALSDLQVDLRPQGHRQAAAPKASRTAPEQAAGAPAEKAGSTPDFGARAARLLDVYFRLIPDSVRIDRLTLHSDIDGIHQALYVPRLEFSGPAFETTLEVYDQGRSWACLVSGKIDRDRQRLELRLRPRRDARATAPHGAAGAIPPADTPAPLPFSERQWGLRLGFDSAKIVLASRGRRQGVLSVEGSLAIGGLALNHPRIAADDVLLPIASLDYRLDIGRDYFELREPTRARIHKLQFRPLVRIQPVPAWQMRLRVPETRFAADDLFSSLPAGLFTRLAGIRTSGELSFHLDFAIDLSRPGELELDVALRKSGFRIRRFGNADLRHFAGPFLYTAYEQDRPAASFVVGPENPDFVPLDGIPERLQHAVMISEDGAFFSHHGFLLEPFKNSIVANLRAGRFVRGASTISMQLVKNLYLRRNKTIARKLEELLITWLIEENRLVSKERMLETYLNIIEWGPGIYGARPAARYYFAKDIGELTLAESIFLAAIVPRPKRFMGFFGDEQRLRPWLARYYADVSRKMLARGWISQFDFDTLLPEVTLTGPARLLLKGAPAEPVAPEEVLLGDEASEAADRNSDS